MKIDIRKGFDAIKKGEIEYFEKYTFDKPIVMTLNTCKELKELGIIINKAILHMNKNYKNYLDIMLRDKKDLEILNICENYSTTAGTFRIDFVVDINNNIQIIEMGTRHPFDGYFASGFFNEMGKKRAAKLGIKNEIDLYTKFFNYLEHIIGDQNRICIVKGNDRIEELRLYEVIFKEAGLEVCILDIKELINNVESLENAFIILELSIEEIRSLSKEDIQTLMTHKMINSINTVLTTHNKSFFQALNDTSFLSSFLTNEEKGILLKYITPTYSIEKDKLQWENAYREKDKYILKHKIKGRSEDVYAGTMTEEKNWRILFDNNNVKDMILQPFIDQKKFKGSIGSEQREDYITGTLLYVNKEFFGPGVLRTSSVPVTNVTDFRKATQIVADCNEKLEGIYYL